MSQTRAASELRAWCLARGLDASALGRLVGCSPGTVQRWFTGRQAPALGFRTRLYELTGLDHFRPPAHRTTASPASVAATASPAPVAATASPAPVDSYAPAAVRVERALRALETALRPFCRSPVEARDYLRRSIDPARLARVTNLAQLLMDEEAFSDWLLLEGLFDGEET